MVADIVSWGWMFVAMLGNSPRWWRIAVAKDQSVNAARGGKEDETVSSAAGRAMQRGDRWGCVLCRWLDLFEKDHCLKSIGK
jgi:hypothetical protein